MALAGRDNSLIMNDSLEENISNLCTISIFEDDTDNYLLLMAKINSDFSILKRSQYLVFELNRLRCRILVWVNDNFITFTTLSEVSLVVMSSTSE